ncbi:hypothetical protein [Aureibaculum luteum]|uniref:hypothetical protein n=1 Tax=Aureibaculum luteum TaxID=1548456 RepID=UPI000E4AC6EA|nr:hypothetical protein [Aureibaculum luteum]
MFKLFYKLVILFLAFILVDFLLGFTLDSIIDKSPDGRYFKAQYSLESSKEDIMIFGASRAECHIAPSIIEQSLKMTCWNAGRGNQTLPFWISMAEGILKRHTPKLAILDIEADYLSSGLSGSYEPSAGMLRPFYREHKEIRPMINKVSVFEQYFNYSKLYAYNSSYYYLLRPYLIKGLDGKLEDKGWKPVTGQMQPDNSTQTIIDTKRVLNKETVKLFNELISNFTKKGCPVFIVISPRYNEIIKNTSTLDYIRNMKNVYLVNFDDNIIFSKDYRNFRDESHLNKEAAIKFTNVLVEKMIRMNIDSIVEQNK